MLYFLRQRGEYIKRKINWQLYSNDKKIIDYKNIECALEKDKLIIFKENLTTNTIDIQNKKYLRENNDFLFEIDFLNKSFKYVLKENNLTFQDNLEYCTFINKDKITMQYTLDNEIKKIIIQIL